ncbi:MULTISPECIES: gluconokinase [unclassified Arcicella]|uniref:gluconokinase n=1 Tax=unclassified Arcicella TaxID=2644986 RepID=UPI00286248AC|nr:MULTISPECIES: gluconokinase [unclassified Arcicella]MDR6562031.1 gluconokinase [Arcicella sp. BE51]MDR6811903.1 gluconokinase [Arcicella sp. BE140]MDR6822933.1 gluconokinase [Arcicella sp. BE139]
MSHFYIGIDIGTTATKAIVFTNEGKIIQQYSKEYDMYHPKSDWSIQKPSDILEAVLECIEKLTENINPYFISFSSAMQSLIAVDEKGNPLTDVILWADNRASAEASELKESELGKQFYGKTGIPIHTFCPMTKILWLRENQPDIFISTHKFISIKEYVWHHLTGEFVVDSSMASGTGLMNIADLTWNIDILTHLGINESKLSTIVSPKHTAQTLIGNKTLVIGAGDGALANLGTGAMEKGRMSLTIGTSGAVRLPIEEPFIDGKMRTQCYHLVDNQYLVLGAVNNGAVILQWLKEAILETQESFESLFEQANTIDAGSNGLIFVPYLLGERAPIWDASAQGTLLGITINHTKAHFIRATLEGILFGLLSITDILLPEKSARKNLTIMASGGFAKSDVWLQIAADIFQMKVVVSQTIEGSAWGAVMLGLDAFGMTTHCLDIDEKIFIPNPTHERVYQESFRKFNKVYEALKSL